jgi:hypothetical protein
VRRLALAAAFLFLFACNRDATRASWQKMSPDNRVLYVQTLIGAEKAKDAKGGGGKHYPLPPEEYVKKIDAAYARGDARDVAAIFNELGDR